MGPPRTKSAMWRSKPDMDSSESGFVAEEEDEAEEGAAPFFAAPAAPPSPSTSSPAAPLPLSLLPATYAQLARDFAILGWPAFGGPSAHVAQFVLLFTEGGKRRWLSTSVFAELFALAQCVPGPSSTQLAYG